MPNHAEPNTERADRILDAAGSLLLRMGYRKVTIEDIARQAGVGKGTVYLHWRTKDQVFEACLMRESARITEEMLDLVRADPSQVLPHRFAASTLLLTAGRPLVLALLTGDSELLGKLKDNPMRGRKVVATDHYFELITARGLLRADVENVTYGVSAVLAGFFLIDSLHTFGMSREAQAESLSQIIRRSFEPDGEPDPAVVEATADAFVEYLGELASGYRKLIYT